MLFRIFTVLAVAALAISTWILSSPAHRPLQILGAAQADLPGYYLKDALLTDYDAAGTPSIRLEAGRIDQIDHGTEVALSNVRVRYQAPNGQNWVLTGDTGHVQPGGKLIDVAGDVRLQGGADQAATEVVLTDSLTYDVPDSSVSTKSDVRVEFGSHTLTARGLLANLKDRSIHLESKVNGRFQR
jgi:lipopolysaccharide export system protein LptC